jgi:predicted DNA-binding protein with PD1-like motif
MKTYFHFLIVLMLMQAFSLDSNAQKPTGMKSVMTTVSLRLKPKEDLKATLDEFVKVHKIKAACIVTCVGSLDVAAIRFANQQDATIVVGKLEIVSLTGTLAESGSHLHISVSDSTGKTTGGHLKEGSLIYTTAEIVLGILPEVVFTRETDSTFGYKELMIKPAAKFPR